MSPQFLPRSVKDRVRLAPYELARQLAWTRREFLRCTAGIALGSSLLPSSLAARTGVAASKRKVIVITFGGGARDQETFAPEGQENIPHLMRELIPQSAFFTQVVNRGILGHYVATASLATGVYETINNFASLPPEHPTIFEYFRKDLKRPASDVWVVAPSNGFNRIGESSHRSYGPGLGARVILPKHLLTAATSGGTDYDHLLRDNYETPYYTPELGGNGFQHHRTGDALSRTTWMMALGAGVREGVVFDRPMESTDLVPTLGSMLGFSAPLAQGKPIQELL